MLPRQYYTGRLAYTCGDQLADNPCKKETSEWLEWIRGWRAQESVDLIDQQNKLDNYGLWQDHRFID